MNILFLGSFYLPGILNNIQSCKRVGNANDLLQKSYLQGLVASKFVDSIYAISTPNLLSFPNKGVPLYVEQIKESLYGIVCHSLSFINLPLLKHFSKYWNLVKYVKRNVDLISRINCLIVYDLDVSFLLLSKFLKYKYPNMKIIFVVPDLIGQTGLKKNWITSIYIHLSDLIAKSCYPTISLFVFITEAMSQYLNVSKDYLVIEGVYNLEAEKIFSLARNNNNTKNRILYSGAMNSRNGVLMLLNAFELIKDDSYELILCGDGPLNSYIVKISTIDDRVKFLGNISHDEVLKLQKEATLLINPRPGIEDFTNYSFPSKTMEYFASGTPVLMYKLPGVPIEYYKYCYLLQNLSEDELANKIIITCTSSKQYRQKMGLAARNFILNNKTPEIQINKIISILLKD